MQTSPTEQKSTGKSSVPDFSEVALESPAPPAGSAEEWQAAVAKAADGTEAPLWETPEGIAVKPLYTGEDLEGLDALHSYPGIAPYLRGPYPTMYVNQPWTIRQYAGFSTAEESNAFYRRNLAAGQRVSRRLRPADPPGVRQRPPAGDRRCRYGRGGDRLDLRHASAVRRHSAGPARRCR
ncbi:hypothetical protein SMICM304S_02159 [Streptomyces microflavus]